MLEKIKKMNSKDVELMCSEIEFRLKNEMFDDFIKGSLESLLDYGKLTIMNRAFPKVEDGLKPVHRRILMTMKDLNLSSTSPFKKSARICGNCIGTYHPHGDCLAGDTLILSDKGLLTLEEMYKKQGKYKVYSQDGFEILDNVRIGQYTDEEYEIHLSNGGIIKATGNHPIFIDKWIKTEDLKVGMILNSLNINENKNKLFHKLNISMKEGFKRIFNEGDITWENYEKKITHNEHVDLGLIKNFYEPKEFIELFLKDDFIYIKEIKINKVNKKPMYDFSVKNKECVYISVGNSMVLVHNSSVYDAMVRMAQDFAMREVLVEGQGNFGTIEGDSPASSRYTEATVSKVGESFFKDLEKNVVDTKDNYDETMKEPLVLPVKYPNLLINGTSGIAVGMTSKIPPHNPVEVINACKYMIEQKKENKEVDIDELVKILPAPDFPTGGICYNGNMKDIMVSGVGKFKLKAKYEIEKKKNKEMIIIKEIPYQINLASVFSKLQEISNNRKKEANYEYFEKSIVGLRNESGRDGLRIVIELRNGVDSNLLWNKLIKVCSLDETVIYNNNVIDVDGMPKLMGIKDILESFIVFRINVITRKYLYIKEEAKDKLEIIEGYIKALSMIDLIIKLIRESDSEDIAIEEIIKLGFSIRQTKAIVNLRLGRLTKLEILTLEKEKLNLENIINNAEKILKSDVLKYKEILVDLDESISLFKNVSRKTEIGSGADEELILHPHEESVLYFSKIGYIKKELLKKDKGYETTENDEVIKRVECSSLDILYCICKSGMVYGLRVYDIDKLHISSIIGKDVIVDYIIGEGNFIFGTKKGFVKKTNFKDFSGALRTSGVIGIKLKEDDEVVFAGLEKDYVILFSKEGKCIKFESSTVPVVGRASQGVVGIKGEVIFGCSEGNILLTSLNGTEIKVKTEELNIQGRAGKGVYFKKADKKTGEWIKGELI